MDLAQGTITNLEFGEAYLWLLFGIVMSVLVPIAARLLKPAAAMMTMTVEERRNAVLKRYLSIGAAAAIIALLFAVVFEFDSTKFAFLAGYAWDSTLQKVVP